MTEVKTPISVIVRRKRINTEERMEGRAIESTGRLNAVEFERICAKRKAYYLPHIPNGDQFGHPGHYYPGIAVEGEPGYYVTDWDYGTDRDLAAECVARLNARLGLTDEDADRIILSSMYSGPRKSNATR